MLPDTHTTPRKCCQKHKRTSADTKIMFRGLGAFSTGVAPFPRALTTTVAPRLTAAPCASTGALNALLHAAPAWYTGLAMLCFNEAIGATTLLLGAWEASFCCSCMVNAMREGMIYDCSRKCGMAVGPVQWLLRLTGSFD